LHFLIIIYLFDYLFVVHKMTLSVASATQRRIGREMEGKDSVEIRGSVPTSIEQVDLRRKLLEKLYFTILGPPPTDGSKRDGLETNAEKSKHAYVC
jgi:hypothetical protein